MKTSPCQNQTALGTSVRGKNTAQLVDQLEVIAAWKEDLQYRIARGQLIFETVGLSVERHDKLITEARAFITVCAMFAESIPGSLVMIAQDQRRAA